MTPIKLKNDRPSRLQLSAFGPHRFGGSAIHRGIVPDNSSSPLHLLLLVDTTDPNCPVKASGCRYLPLYYPLKYGTGGPTLQYAVPSDDAIRILYLSSEQPDESAQQYVQVNELPASSAHIIPLTYDQDRIVVYSEFGGYFQPSAPDAEIIRELSREHDMIAIGGGRRLPINAGDVICRNRQCEFFNRRIWFDTIAAIPPIAVDGSDEFWHEYQGSDVKFYFGLCRHCGTVIAFLMWPVDFQAPSPVWVND